DRRARPRGGVRTRRGQGAAGMSGAMRTVFLKEVLENLRDRRVILSALLFGVLFPPLIFGLMTTRLSSHAAQAQDEPLELVVSGAHHAPNLMRFLQENGVRTTPAELTPEEAMRAVRSGEREIVLLLDEAYGAKLQSGESAPVELVVDSADSQA